jgi:hypothetical protein
MKLSTVTTLNLGWKMFASNRIEPDTEITDENELFEGDFISWQ